MYSPKVMQNFSNPQNVGEIPDADGVGTVGNPVCGDLMTIYIKVKDDRIADIKFKTFGCGAAIATSSMVTQMAKGKTVDEALKITRERRGRRSWAACPRRRCTAPTSPPRRWRPPSRITGKSWRRRKIAGVHARTVADRPPLHFLPYGIHFNR